MSGHLDKVFSLYFSLLLIVAYADGLLPQISSCFRNGLQLMVEERDIISTARFLYRNMTKWLRLALSIRYDA